MSGLQVGAGQVLGLGLETPGTPEEYGVCFRRLTGDEGIILLDPHLERIEQVNYARFYLGDVVIYIKVDKRPTPPGLRHAQAGEGGLLVVCQEKRKSKEWSVMLGVIEACRSANG